MNNNRLGFSLATKNLWLWNRHYLNVFFYDHLALNIEQSTLVTFLLFIFFLCPYKNKHNFPCTRHYVSHNLYRNRDWMWFKVYFFHFFFFFFLLICTCTSINVTICMSRPHTKKKQKNFCKGNEQTSNKVKSSHTHVQCSD